MSGHHVILGTMIDYLTGEVIQDTHDERYLQKIARLLVGEKGFNRYALFFKTFYPVVIGKKEGRIRVEFLVQHGGVIGLVIKYAPGSLVTRYTPAIAISRFIVPYQIPLVAVTNGEDAHLLDGRRGTLLARGFDALPDRRKLQKVVAGMDMASISEKTKELARRILFAYEIDGACSCDGNESYGCAQRVSYGS